MKKIWKRKVNPISSSKWSYGEPSWTKDVLLADFGNGIVVFENGEWHNNWGSIVKEWENKTNNKLNTWERLMFIDSVTSSYISLDTDIISVEVRPRTLTDKQPEYKIIKLSKKQTEKIKERMK